MANYLSFMVTTQPLESDNPTAVHAVLAQFAVCADTGEGRYCDDGLYYSEGTSGSFWLGGYDAADPGDLTLGDIEPARDTGERDAIGGGGFPPADLTLSAALQPHIRRGTVWAYQIVGYENLRYVWGHVAVVTRDRVAYDNLDAAEGRLARELLLPGKDAAPAASSRPASDRESPPDRPNTMGTPGLALPIGEEAMPDQHDPHDRSAQLSSPPGAIARPTAGEAVADRAVHMPMRDNGHDGPEHAQPRPGGGPTGGLR